MKPPIRFAILFEPRDLWVGVFWDTTHEWSHYDYGEAKKLKLLQLRIFVTLVPMFPLRISIDIQRMKRTPPPPRVDGEKP